MQFLFLKFHINALCFWKYLPFKQDAGSDLCMCKWESGVQMVRKLPHVDSWVYVPFQAIKVTHLNIWEVGGKKTDYLWRCFYKKQCFIVLRLTLSRLENQSRNCKAAAYRSLYWYSVIWGSLFSFYQPWFSVSGVFEFCCTHPGLLYTPSPLKRKIFLVVYDDAQKCECRYSSLILVLFTPSTNATVVISPSYHNLDQEPFWIPLCVAHALRG